MRIALPDVELHYEVRGSGPPLVLVHGLGASTAIWQKVAGPLSDDFRVIAYDLRGLGRSSTPSGPYTVGALLADLHGLAEALELERFLLVGHSLGGAVAVCYAARHPERLSGLVSVSAPSAAAEAQGPMLEKRAAIARRDGMQAVAAIHAQAGFPDAFRLQRARDVATYRSIIAGGDPEGYAALCGVIETLRNAQDLARIETPTLLIAGERDRIVAPEAVRASAAAIDGCEYVELEGCGHIVPFERPDELVRAIRDFASRLAASAVL
jgi:3-oxoadipate enol-lactonase